jgi:Txe/YoeB family toxin of Txe-Axe toxin-antitoxin module
MNDELKNKLIAALKLKGLGEGIASLINIADESEIEGAIASLTASLPQLTKEQKLADKEVQSEIDRRVTMALNKQPEPPKAPTPTTDDTPEWAKSLIEQNKALSEKVNAIETGKLTESKQQQALSALQKSEVLNDSIKSKWANRIDINSEVSFEEQVKGLENEFTELRQGLVDQTALAGSSPMVVPTGKISESELDNLVSSFNI